MKNSSSINQIVLAALNSSAAQPSAEAYSVGSVDGLNFIACAIGSELVVLTESFKKIQEIRSGGGQASNGAGGGADPITAVNCCRDSGKIAICCHKSIQIFEPILQSEWQVFPFQWMETQGWEVENRVDDLQWVLDGFRLLIFADTQLCLYQHKILSCAVNSSGGRPTSLNGTGGGGGSNVKFTLNPAEDECTWEVIWSTRLVSRIKLVRFSDDGTLFATCGEQDPFVKVWYQLKDSHSFSFIYIRHPAPVCGFEWRRSSGHLTMPRRLVHNALLTWCEDNTVRIWKEIPSNKPSPELHFLNAVQNAFAMMGGDKENHQQQQHGIGHSNGIGLGKKIGGGGGAVHLPHHQQHSHQSHRVALQMRKARGRIVHRLRNLINDKRKLGIIEDSAAAAHSLPSDLDNLVRSSTFADFSIPAYTPADTLVFCLAATINAETDCFLVPSMASSGGSGSSNGTADNENGSCSNLEAKEANKKKSSNNKRRRRPRPFTVHWLNNKEYQFEVGTQQILAEIGHMLLAADGSRDVSPCQMMHSLHSSTSSAGLAAAVETPTQHLPVQPPHQSITTPNLMRAGAQMVEPNVAENPTQKDVVDYKLEKLLRQWAKSCDILFTIHPMDGSLLTWTLEWLDDPWKQPIVSFASRIPEAFSPGDATTRSIHVNTLRPSVHCLSEYTQHQQQQQRNKKTAATPAAEESSGIGAEEQAQQQHQQEMQCWSNRNKFMAENNEILLLNGHENGELNLWRLQVESGVDGGSGGGREAQQQTASQRQNAMSVVNVIHGYRLCEPSKEPTALEILKREGLFDATILSQLLLPQYHPVQLIGMLNAGRIQRVRAVLINVLRALRFRQQGGSFSMVVNKSFGGGGGGGRSGGSATGKRLLLAEANADSSLGDSAEPTGLFQRRNSISAAMSPFDTSELEYDELEAITPLPLYALLAVDSNNNQNQQQQQQQQSKAAEKSAVEKTNSGGGSRGERGGQQEKQQQEEEPTNAYDSLFAQSFTEEELDIDKLKDFDMDAQSYEGGRKSSIGGRNRKISLGSLGDPSLAALMASAASNPNAIPPTKFTTKHSRFLTEMLTHTHLPGLSSVDQMHLLAVADTISHFSANTLVDRLAQANAALQPAVMSSLGDSTASGYASAAAGMDTVDECGLRFLMAKKQHEYLLRCLPLKQRRQLKAKGISTAYVIWAFHSDTETELLNSIPCCQRQQENWEELRSYGIAWWLRNNATLRICMERVAKNAFQKDQQPLDAAIYYLAMRKKNVLTQLFKTTNDSRMYEFFREDFATSEKWKKAALKNAFLLMSKQRFHHAAAFFLLGGSIKDALQTILSRIRDLQLAIIVLRLYETDPEAQLELITELLCREVLGCEPSHIRSRKEGRGIGGGGVGGRVAFPNAKRDPFERSMSLWIMKEYVLSAETLMEEASLASQENLSAMGIDNESGGGQQQQRAGRFDSDLDHREPSLPDIFNFYSFLRRHPLVIRQKLAIAGITTTTTEQFLTWIRKIGAKVSVNERRLYLRTANAHLAMGCPLLALDVLSSLPDQVDFREDGEEEELKPEPVKASATAAKSQSQQQQQQSEIDWSAPVTQLKEDKLELEWSEEEEEEEEEEKVPKTEATEEEKEEKEVEKVEEVPKPEEVPKSAAKSSSKCPVEFQQLKLHSTLSIITDELNTLATGGYEVTGGQLRLELFCWLEKECEVLRRLCFAEEEDAEEEEREREEGQEGGGQEGQGGHHGIGRRQHGEEYANSAAGAEAEDVHGSMSSSFGSQSMAQNQQNQQQQQQPSADQHQLPPLHEALQQDRLEIRERVQLIVRRRDWLRRHQRLLHTLAAYCGIHGERNVRLIAIEMELLLLLLEVQRSEEDALRHVNEPLPDIRSFPLLVSSLSANVHSPISPLCFILDQCSSLLSAINEFDQAPQIETDIPKVTKLFNLCQGVSFCVYQSLSNIENLAASTVRFTGPLTQRIRHCSLSSTASSSSEELQVRSQPNQWPGVNSLIALLTRERLLDESPPNLRLLLIQFFVSIFESLFFYAFALYDSRLLYRLSAHPVSGKMFAELFGGGGERRLRSAVPVRPPPPKLDAKSERDGTSGPPQNVDKDELAAIRAKLHAKVFTASSKPLAVQQQQKVPPQAPGSSEQVIQCWISPRKHIVQYFTDKIPIEQQGALLSDFYDSEQESEEPEKEELLNLNNNNDGTASDYFRFQDADYLPGDEATKKAQVLPHDSPEGYAWTLMRLALLRQMCAKLDHFVEMAGFDFREVARNFPKLEQATRKLHLWAAQLEDKLESQAEGCPADLLPNMHVQDMPDLDSQHHHHHHIGQPLLRKYHVLVEPGNTPFEYDEAGVKPVRRLWMQLVRQDELMPIFVRYIFGKNQNRSKTVGAMLETTAADSSAGASQQQQHILSVIKLIHREHDPIVAFAINSVKHGHIVLSTGRELQELSIERVLEEKERVLARAAQFPSTTSFLIGQNRAELDIHMQLNMQQQQRDPLRDNDDYQLLVPGADGNAAGGGGGRTILSQTSSHALNPYIIDRSRLCLQKLRKRPISGIRRLEAHCSLPYYVSGSSDGSILLWEWGVEQPCFVARMAGQYAKVVKLAFAQNGSRFAAVDGDGLLCLWQAQPGMASRKPYFSQKCHNKFVADVKYIGQTSTLLITAGLSTGDQNIVLWDTIMPQAKAIVHSFVGHADGAQCIAYQPNTQSIISGGKHGEICIWDVRQRQLRHTFRAFDSAGSSVKCVCLDPNADIIAAGSNEGDIKIWSATTPVPQLLYSLPTEHVSRSGFSLRQVAQISLQGVQQMQIDHRMRMFSCGADNSLKIRTIPSLQ